MIVPGKFEGEKEGGKEGRNKRRCLRTRVEIGTQKINEIRTGGM